MQVSHWDTSTAAPKRQFDLYRSGLCASFAHLTPRCDAPNDAFSASLNTWTDGAQSLTQMSCQSHWVERTREDLKRVEDDHLYLNIVVKGEMHVRQGETCRCLRAGEMIILDNARPFEVQLVKKRGYMHFALRLPRSALPDEMVRDPKLLSHHPGSHLLRKCFSLLAEAPEDLRTDLVQPALATLNAVVSHMATTFPEPQNHRREFSTRSAIQKIIAARHADPEFSLPQAVSELGLTQRTVQHHLALSGTSFSKLLKDFRLNQALDLVTEGANQVQKGMRFEEVAFRTGFTDLSTFYRAFKRKFGKTPGQLRQSAHLERRVQPQL